MQPDINIHLVMSLPATYVLWHRFCVSRKGRTAGGGWVHLKGTNSMAVSGLHFIG